MSVPHSNPGGMAATLGGLTMTILTYTQIVISIIAGVATFAAAIYTMWPGISGWLRSKGWMK